MNAFLKKLFYFYCLWFMSKDCAVQNKLLGSEFSFMILKVYSIFFQYSRELNRVNLTPAEFRIYSKTLFSERCIQVAGTELQRSAICIFKTWRVDKRWSRVICHKFLRCSNKGNWNVYFLFSQNQFDTNAFATFEASERVKSWVFIYVFICATLVK